MSKLRDAWNIIRGRKPPVPGTVELRKGAPPVIHTPFGDVTEGARLRCAMNMLEDGTLRQRVEDLLIRQNGGNVEVGIAEAKKRYPEAYEELT